MINIKKLDCGVRLATDKLDHVGSAAIGIFVRTGSIDEDIKYNGISHYVEHMMFKGTTNRNSKQIVDELDGLGSQINAFTSKEFTCYYVKTLASNLYKSTDILLDMLTNSIFDKKEMDRERLVIAEEIKMTLDTPDDECHDMISKIVNKGTPLEKSIAGTYSSIKRISRNVMTKYVDEEYTRDNIVVVVTGKFDEQEITDYIEGKLDNLKPTKKEKTFEIPTYEPRFKNKIKDIEQTHIFMGVPSLKITDKRYYSMAILSNMLGGSMSSRLFQNVREDKGLAYSVYSSNFAAKTGGNFLIYAGVGHDNTRAAIDAIKEELLSVENNGFTDSEIQKSKEQLKASFIFGLENVASRMFSIGKAISLTNKIKTDDEVLFEIDKITQDDIKEVSKIISDPYNYSCAVVSNKKVNIKQIVQG